MVADRPSGYPRVSKRVEHGVEIALTVLWLGGAIYLREVLETGWSGPIVLLVVVVAIEVAFVVWNRGGVRAAAEADKNPS